jgi:hypothetical protein
MQSIDKIPRPISESSGLGPFLRTSLKIKACLSQVHTNHEVDNKTHDVEVSESEWLVWRIRDDAIWIDIVVVVDDISLTMDRVVVRWQSLFRLAFCGQMKSEIFHLLVSSQLAN